MDAVLRFNGSMRESSVSNHSFTVIQVASLLRSPLESEFLPRVIDRLFLGPKICVRDLESSVS